MTVTGTESPFIAKLNLPGSGGFSINIGGNFNLCSGQSATLTAGGANTYTWINGPGTNIYVVTPTVTSQYTVSGTSIYGCSTSTAIQTVSVSPNPTILVNASKTLVCQGSPLTLSVTGANTYTWYSGAQSSTINLSAFSTQVYSVTGTSTLSGCTATAALQVSVTSCKGVAENTATGDWKVFPNPFKNDLIVHVGNAFTLSIYNIYGDRVAVVSESVTDNRVDVSTLTAGVYFVVLESGTEKKVIKVYKE